MQKAETKPLEPNGKKRCGRPRLTPQTHFKGALPTELYEKMSELALEDGITIRDLLRRIVGAYFGVREGGKR